MSDSVEKSSRNSNSLSKNSTQAIKVLLPFPVDIPKVVHNDNSEGRLTVPSL